jgi:hypothetical protein
MFSEEDAEYSEALKMGPISAIVLDGDAKEPRVGMVSILDPFLKSLLSILLILRL